MPENLTSQSPQNIEQKWTGWHTLSLVIIIVAIMLVGLRTESLGRLWAWLITLILLTIFAAMAGYGITGLWKGLLIDEQNKISLSRLQMTLWTIIVLSGFLIAALSNIATGRKDPLSIAIPSELWVLMGISTTSLIGSPLIKSTKVAKTANPAEKQINCALLAKQGVDTSKIIVKGLLVVNTTFEQASWSDLFKGEEIGNSHQLDLGKIQMFYFTLILVFTYAVTLGTALSSSTVKISDFPAFDSSMVALMGISHAGYLINKAVPHSSEG